MTDWEDRQLITEQLMDKLERVVRDNRHDINIIRRSMSSMETKPTYTAPTCSINLNPSLIEIGKSTPIRLSYSYNQNDGGTITSVKYYVNGTEVTSPYTISSATSFTVEISYADGDIKYSNFGNPCPEGVIKAATIRKTATVSAEHLSYYGVNEATTSVLKTTRNLDWRGINCTKGVLIYKYPKTLGKLTSIRDANNFEYISSYTLTEDDIYYTYTLRDPMTVTDGVQIYR